MLYADTWQAAGLPKAKGPVQGKTRFLICADPANHSPKARHGGMVY